MKAKILQQKHTQTHIQFFSRNLIDHIKSMNYCSNIIQDGPILSKPFRCQMSELTLFIPFSRKINLINIV